MSVESSSPLIIPAPFNKPLVDHRVYTIKPRLMPKFLEILDRLGMPVLIATLGRPIGIYTSYVGELNQLVHFWGYDDMADYERRGKARDTHPDFPAYLAATVDIVIAQENRLIRTANLPSLK
jgi:NIPSNAP